MKGMEYGPVVTITAGETITQKRFVDFAGKHTVDIRGIGVALDDTASGDPISVQITGIAVVECGGNVTAGNLLSADANGKAIALTYDNVNDFAKYCGVAMDDGVDGGFIRVALR